MTAQALPIEFFRVRDGELGCSHPLPVGEGRGEGLSIPAAFNFRMLNSHRSTLLPRLTAIAAAAQMLLSAQAQTAPTPAVRAPLPVTCAQTACAGFPNAQGLSSTVNRFVGRGAGSVGVAGNTMTVNQTSSTALFNWRSFDIASGNTVNFNQTVGRNAVAINRIHDTQASRIDGNLSASGQVYLINPNGLLFGSGANVDVAGLIASTLDINPNRVESGLLGRPNVEAAFSVVNTPQAASAGVDIQSGARIHAGTSQTVNNQTVTQAGSVFIFAPRVNNEGAITVTPGGQVVMAAGERIFLAGSDSATLRGLLVEVGQGGVVSNRGEIATPRGNTTMVGMAVNQSGRINATSAINENGSIRLLAREVTTTVAGTAGALVDPQPGNFLNVGTVGRVDIGAGSSTSVTLDGADRGTASLDDENAAAARSTIVAEGRQIVVGGSGAAGQTVLQARGGDVILQARASLGVINEPASSTTTTLGAANGAATLTIGSDVKIDVSGERDAVVDGARNYVFIDRLTSNELRDAPLQRDGFLRGQGVHINVAQDHAFIDVSNRRDAVSGTQAERNASGGLIALRAEGSVNVAQGATFDMSGGTTRTTAATGRTSQLVTESGRVVDIANARADERYVGFADRHTVSVDAPREGTVGSRTFDAPVVTATPEFVDGKAAGVLEINAPRGSMAGVVLGHTSPGAQQRGSLPAGGQLRLGSVANSSSPVDNQINYLRPNVLLSNTPADAAFQVPGSQAEQLFVIDSNMLRSGDITRLDVRSDGVVTVASGADLDAGPGGSIALRGAQVDVNTNLTARGGSIAVEDYVRDPGADAPRLVPLAEAGRIRFGRGVALDASGLYTSDVGTPPTVSPSTPIVRNGGSISVRGRDVDVSDVALFNVDAGASVSASAVASGGRAGRVSILSNPLLPATLDEPSVGRLNLGEGFAERVRGFGFSAGGSLTLAAPRASLGAGGDAAATSFDLGVLDRGFEAFTFQGADFLEVTPGTVLAPTPRLYGFRRDEPLPAAGASLAQALVPQAPVPGSERPTSVTLTASRASGTVRIGQEALIDAGAAGSVQVQAGQSIVSEGELRARGGTVSLTLNPVALSNAEATTARFEQHAIHLAEGARIDVSGMSRVQTGADGRRSGAVLDGGQVTVNAERGSFALDARAAIVADGARDAVDLRQGNNLVRTEVASRGGAVAIRAQNGLFVQGEVSGRAGGAQVEGGRLSVRLEGLLINERIPGQATSPSQELFDSTYSADRVLSITEQATLLPEAGGRFSAPNYAGRGQVRPGLVNDSGFDTVQLGSSNTIDVQGNTTLSTASALTLDAQALRVGPGATLSLNAPRLSLGFLASRSSYAANLDADPSGGTGRLTARAEHIDLVSGLSLQGVGQTELNAQGDVRLRGGPPDGSVRPSGQLRSQGSLSITAAQLTPASMTDFTIDLGSGAASRLQLTTNGATPLEPLSAQGSVTLRAREIDIEGRISAPHGRIVVQGSEQVRVGDRASLSVAGTLAVPLGTVFNGTQWVYADNPNFTDSNLASTSGVQWPDKGISLEGPTIDVSPAARLDLSGGGQIVAQEFVAGPGGSIDWRQNTFVTAPGGPSQRNPYFALIPARGDAPAPFDQQIYSGLSSDAAVGGSDLLRTGQTITLGAGSGIPAGTYTVMPARYALLPGAYAVQPAAGYADLTPGASVREATGAVVVAGRLGVGEQASTSRWNGYRVLTGDQFRRLAEWRETTATALLNSAALAAGQAAARTPLDAGSLQIDAQQQLRLSLGSVAAAPASSGSGANAVTGRGTDIGLAAPDVVVSDQPAPNTGTVSDTLQLNAGQLSALGAERLVLGARTAPGEAGALALTTRADTVSVGGTQALTAGEVLLSANTRVNVAAGAQITALATPDTPGVGAQRITSMGDGAALLVSAADELPVWARSGVQGQRGDLSIAPSATLSGRSVVFDASREQTLASSVNFNARNVGLSSGAINLGDAPVGTAGLTLGSGLLTQLSQVDQLTLTSGTVFNVYGNVALGGTAVQRLSLDGAGLIGAVPGANLSVRAGDVALRNSSGAAATGAPQAGTGALNITATTATAATPATATATTPQPSGSITLDGGDVQLAGFAQATLTAQSDTGSNGVARDNTGQIRFNGAGHLQASGDLTLDAARITAGRGADQRATAGGVLRSQAGSADSADTRQEIGARLALSAQRIDHGGRIVLPSGDISLNATGPTAGDDVLLRSGSQLSAAGSTQTFADQRADASAGAVRLASAAGSVRAQAGSEINLNGSGERGDAGALRVQAAQGELALQGRLLTDAGTEARGATVQVDVGRLPSLEALAQPLNAGSGGDAAHMIDVRVRRGDVTLSAGERLRAQQIRIAADGGDAARPRDGQLRIDGTLNASGERAGRVELHARQGITLGAASRIEAASSGAGEEGGSVLLSGRIVPQPATTTLDAIDIKGGARVDVSGGIGAPGGTVTLRAPWQFAPSAQNQASQHNDVAIAHLPADFLVGARSAVVEATYVPVLAPQTNLTLSDTAPASAANPLPTWRSNLQNYMTAVNLSSIIACRGQTCDARFDLRPGLEVRTTGNITVSSAIDFTAGLNTGNFQWRYGGNTLASSQPGALTLRAGGNLTLNGGLRDGYTTVTSTSTGAAINGNATLTPFDADADSWRYQLTGGADLSGASAAAVRAVPAGNTGNLVIQGASATSDAVVRTGTGRIDMAAAGNIELRGTNAAVYTGGQGAADSPPPFDNATVRGFNPNFTTHGGGIRAEAGQDIFFQRSSTQLVNNWLWRAGRTTEVSNEDGTTGVDFSGAGNAPTAWWVNAGTFLQGIGALGGGDVSLQAGRDVRSVTAAVPTNANLRVDASGNAVSLQERNGGTLDVQAGRDIRGGLFYAQRGDINLRADSIGPQSSSDVVILAQGNNLARAQARGDLTVAGSFNPTLAPTINLLGRVALAASPTNAVFSTYGPQSEFELRSLAADVSIDGNLTNTVRNPAGSDLNLTSIGTRPNERISLAALPGTTRLISFGDDVNMLQSRLLWPDSEGQLQVLAHDTVSGGGSSLLDALVMGALDPIELPSAERPQRGVIWRQDQVRNLFAGQLDTVTNVLEVTNLWGLNRPQNHGRSLLHRNDATPVSLVARTGNIENINLQVPKSLQMQAAGDIRDVSVSAQNVSDNDVSRVHAGGRIEMSSSSAGITITGPGVAEVLAGQSIDLGSSQAGIVSSGNLVNPNLPEVGATLLVASGLGVTSSGFVQPPAYDNVLRQFVRHDAFAAAGQDAAEFNEQALALLAKEFASDATLLRQALTDRSAALQPGSAFEQWLSDMSYAQRAQLALALARNVQTVSNQSFVSTSNTQTFAPGYWAFNDLFPTLQASAQGVRQFVADNPFAAADNAQALREEAVAAAPEALREVLRLGLAATAEQRADPGSAFNQALAALPRETLDEGARQLGADVQRIAGRELDALRDSGRVDAGVGTPFARTLDAQARAMSPAGPAGRSDISLVFSQIKSEQSGNLFLLAPQGSVVAGQANPPAGVERKPEYQLGVLTLGGGAITGMVRDNFDVFRSRVFTVAGGDVHLWASVGNIDAGSGARDVRVAPPPRLVIDRATGIASLDISTSVSGSGIGALKTSENQPPSNIRLMAPNGFIDAGEAGIRADTGTVTLGSNVVLNSGNISAPGGVSGGAVVVAPPAPVPQASNTGQADKAVEQAKKALDEQTRDAEERAKKERRKRVTGEFLGFGEGS
jgi:filamentous hemagglutinin